MGASGWWYEVDFQEDLSGALSALKERVLESGDYVHPWNTPWYEPNETIDEYRLQEAAEVPGMDIDELRESMTRLKHGQPPLSIDHLYALAGLDGTHSILDMGLGVGEGPMQVIALESSEYVGLFGTEFPTIDEVRAQKDELMSRRARWMGTAITAYDDSSPAKLVFTGFSGD